MKSRQILTKVQYKFGLGVISFARHLWREPIAAEMPRISLNRHVFLITSTLSPSEKPLASSTRRSIFSAEERLEQTLASIVSVRAKVPSALVVLLENSDLVDAQAKALQDAVDWLVRFDADPTSRILRDHGNKGVGEVYMLQSIQKVLARFDYQLLFKLSARYSLTERFALENFPRDRFGFLLRDGVASTRLYSVPGDLHDLYGRQLASALIAGRFGVSIEDVMTRGLSPHRVKWLNPIGVGGPMGGGGWIDE